MDDFARFTEVLFNPAVLLVSGGIYAILRMLQKSPIRKHWLYARALPFLPESMGVAAWKLGAFAFASSYSQVAQLGLGLLSAVIAQKFQKILGQTILGDDRHARRPDAEGTETISAPPSEGSIPAPTAVLVPKSETKEGG